MDAKKTKNTHLTGGSRFLGNLNICYLQYVRATIAIQQARKLDLHGGLKDFFSFSASHLRTVAKKGLSYRRAKELSLFLPWFLLNKMRVLRNSLKVPVTSAHFSTLFILRNHPIYKLICITVFKELFQCKTDSSATSSRYRTHSPSLLGY